MGLNVQDQRKRFEINPELVKDKNLGTNDSQVISANGAITIKNGPVIITKGSAGAYTLAAPVAGTDDGKLLQIETSTAFAHVVTVTGLPGSLTTLTFAAAIGNSVNLRAYNGKWIPVHNLGVTIA